MRQANESAPHMPLGEDSQGDRKSPRYATNMIVVGHYVSGFRSVTRRLVSLRGLLRQQRSEQTACIHNVADGT